MNRILHPYLFVLALCCVTTEALADAFERGNAFTITSLQEKFRK